MRGSRTLFVAIGAAVSAGLLVEVAASAAGFRLTMSPTTSTSTSTSTSPSTTTTATTTGVSTPGTATSGLTREDVTLALAALAGSGKTLGGPGTFLAGADGNARIYQVLSGAAVNACVTVRNLSQGQIRVSVNDSVSADVNAGETATSCYAGPLAVDLRCRQGTVCEAVWRVDRQ